MIILRFSIFHILFFSIVASCSNQKSSKAHLDGYKEKNEFVLTIKALVKKNDKFQVFYKFDNSQANVFSEDTMMETTIEGKDDYQIIQFKFPKDINKFSKLRIDFGTNFHQEAINFKELKLANGNNHHTFNKIAFGQLFRPNKFVSYDISTGTIRTKVIDNTYDPGFISIPLHEILNDLTVN